MFTSVTVTNPTLSVTVSLAGLSSCVVSGPTGSGKSSVARAVDILLTGECPAGWSATGTTARGTVLSVKPRARTITPPAGTTPARYDNADDYRAALWKKPVSVDTVRGILHADAWQAALGTPKARGFRDLVLSVVPPGDLRAVLVDLMAADGHEVHADDPAHLDDVGPRGAMTPGALSRQKAANAAASEALGALAAERAAYQRAVAARDALPQPDPEARAGAEAVLKTASAWEAYDKAVVASEAAAQRHRDAVARLDAWTAATKAAGERPAYDPAEAHRVRTALGEARAELKAEQDAAAKAAAEEAARAAVEAERARAAESPPVAAPVVAPQPAPALFPAVPPPTPSTCPTCGQSWSR